ncbi:hypothetical protein ACU3L3_06880 [Priestia endophytica]
MSDTLKRQADESFYDYFVRLFANKDTYDVDTYDIKDLLNAEMGSTYSESKWRKDYASYAKWKDYILSKNLDSEILQKYEDNRLEAEKEKVRSQDQKREYRKLIRNQARFEAVRDDIVEAICSLESKKPLEFRPLPSSTNGKEGLVLFSDWHYGMICDNTFNKFNKEIFNQRVEKLVAKTIEYGKRNGIETLHVAQLGDILSGSIHVSTRVQSNEDVIEQVKYAAETLAEVLAKLANTFPKIKFYNVIGNHSRTLPNKNDVGIKENFEYLIPWYLDARLSHFANIDTVVDEDGMVLAEVCGQRVVFVHGNFDRLSTSVKDLPQMLGYIPEYIISGHVHHHYEKEHGSTTQIVNGSLIGADDYAVQKRLFAKPSQKFMVFDKEEGLECSYIIKL